MPFFRRLMPKSFRQKHLLIPTVRLSGVIGAGGTLRKGLTLEAVGAALDKAFNFPDAPAVILIVNSPGGSPVQSHLIHQRIKMLADDKDKDVIVVVEDVAASGGYMIACAGDTIYADPSSIIGSIGVVSAGFGLDRAIERFGIERRVYTAGDRKVSLDPFQPERAEDVKRLKAIQKDIHATFIDLVKSARKDSLDEAQEKTLFSGEFWAAGQALELGLIDGLADVRSIVKERYGDKAKAFILKSEKGGLMGKLGLSERAPSLGVGLDAGAMADGLIDAVENRAHWQRYGL